MSDPGWQMYVVNEPGCPTDIVKEHYKDYPESYKKYGALGDIVAVGFGWGLPLTGTVIDLEDDLRSIETESTIWTQEWNPDASVWIEGGFANKLAIQKMEIKGSTK